MLWLALHDGNKRARPRFEQLLVWSAIHKRGIYTQHSTKAPATMTTTLTGGIRGRTQQQQQQWDQYRQIGNGGGGAANSD